LLQSISIYLATLEVYRILLCGRKTTALWFYTGCCRSPVCSF